MPCFGMHLHYTIVACPLGRLLVAATQRGVRAVKLGDVDAELEHLLFGEFGQATLNRDDVVLKDWVEAILAYLDGKNPHLDLPLDVQRKSPVSARGATAFQRQVWQALQRIPFGETRTYGQVAALIGKPSAVRAVAHACATNPVALIVPCHRVLRKSGELGGYRWGLARKAELLCWERARAHRPDESEA